MTDFSNSNSELNPSQQQQLLKRLPPLRIWDLMVLTASMAFVYMLQDKLRVFQPGLNSEAWNIMGLVTAVPSGISLASIYWIVNQKRLTGKYFLQPGHRILASQAVLMLQLIIVVVLMVAAGGTDISELFQSGAWLTVMLVSFGLINLLASSVLVGGLMFDSVRWRLVLGSSALVLIADGLIYISQSFQIQFIFSSVGAIVGVLRLGASIFCILSLVVAVMIDIRTRTERDWLHWAGVTVLFLATAVVPIAQLIFIRYFFAPE